MSWPPGVRELKAAMGIEPVDGRDDARLAAVLDAAVSFVQERHAGRYNFTGEVLSELPDVPATIVEGTLMLARRWRTRDRSPDGLVQAGELGTSRIPSFDADIERLLRIGRYAPPVIV